MGQVAFIPIPLAVAIALTRYRLWEMDRVVNRTLVYAALTVVLALVYAGVSVIAGSRLSGGAGPVLAVLAAILVAILLQPARARVQLALNRALYGSRDDPYSALSRLGRRLGDNLAPDAVLTLVAHTARESLRSPFVAISVAGEPGMDVRDGDPENEARALAIALIHKGERLGELLVAPRNGEDTLGGADLRLLQDLAVHAAGAIHELRLRHQLLASRESLLIAREEERRRLSRILHDDLGATLAAQKLKAGGILAALPAGSTEARKQLAGLESDLSASIRRLRELAYELRPPALEDLGLRDAIATLLRNHHGRGLELELRMAEPVPVLPAAVELSVYRIVEQAVANVVLHSAARHCVVEIRAGADVLVVIEDDGGGIPAGTRPGVGVSSMRERADELGGTFSLAAGAGGGTRVTASIPLAHK